eukprot:6473323-Alexandrium_andersonii.AAC.1
MLRPDLVVGELEVAGCESPDLLAPPAPAARVLLPGLADEPDLLEVDHVRGLLVVVERRLASQAECLPPRDPELQCPEE